ncbi:MAG TPA: cation diffusion facilitator family transporter [Luteibaculaceae bacterium]|nr:cation diffusion facilitator family transporter [Luteibaculaceae bacterium]
MEMLIAAARHNFGSLSFRIEKRTALYLALVLTVVVMLVEWIAGVKTNSVMLQSDAVHMLSHAASLGVSLVAICLGASDAGSSDQVRTKRYEAMGAFVNGLLLILFTGQIFWMGFVKAIDPSAVNVAQGLSVAFIGLATNLICALILAWGGVEDLNSKSAFYHLLADTFSSVVIIVGMVVIKYTSWFWVDAALSVGVAVVVAKWCIRLLKESSRVLLQMKPRWVKEEKIAQDLFNRFDLLIQPPKVNVWECAPGQCVVVIHGAVYPGTHLEYRNLKNEIRKRLETQVNAVSVKIELDC